METEVAIYSAKTSPRLDYVLDYLFVERYKTTYKHYTNSSTFQESSHFLKINYSDTPISNCIQVLPNSILFETGCMEKTNILFDYISEKFCMPFAQKETEIGFDIFACVFWFLSRYEEYLPFNPDAHSRFSAEATAIPKQWVNKPILDLAIIHFAKKIKLHTHTRFAIYPTIDIDMAFYYHGKKTLQKIAYYLRRILGKALWRGKTVDEDPYNTFPYEKSIFEKYANKNVRYFYLIGENSTYDKSISSSFVPFQNRIRATAAFAEIGMHPSYQSNENPLLLPNEKSQLEFILGKTVVRSRQHFLKMQFDALRVEKNTYFQLIQNGILHDYSMGFADAVGFRAGTACSFSWYNIAEEKTTNLRIHPFCLMDVTLKNYMHKNSEEAETIVQEIKTILKENHLPFCFLFHNESISNLGDWKNWRKVFEKCLEN